MKKIFFLLFIINSVYAQPPGQWMWIHGSSTANTANWGVQGVPSPTNVPPGALYEPCEWTDLNGKFWMFGGGAYAALWKYDPLTNEWTWIKGPNTTNYAGSYGVLGVPSPTNAPSYRTRGVATWTDNAGDLWLFGGSYKSDLWRYNIATNVWTWMNGPMAANQPGVYGTQGVPAPGNIPGGRDETAATWVDAAGDLWLFGGETTGLMNDLWRYNIATNMWTWMKGSSTINPPAVYGTQTVEAAANTPSGRMAYCRWTDNSGNFWLFGGGTFSGAGAYHHDLWRYNPVTNNWTWMHGTTSTNATGLYGPMCNTSPAKVPTGRFEDRIAWKDVNGNLWMFGGARTAAVNPVYNDLWMYCVASNEWTWISCDSTANPVANYGIIGVPSPTNKPKGIGGGVGWADVSNSQLYVFNGINSTTALWRFTIDPSCYTCSSTVQPLLVNATNNAAVCVGSCTNVSATASGGTPPYTYVWTPAIGIGAGPHPVCPTTTTTYYVTVTDSLANSATDSVTITVNPLPVILTSTPSPICVGDSAVLTATGASTYSWLPCTFLSPCTGSTVTAYPPVTTPYTVTGIDTNGCSSTASVTVAVSPLPLVVSPPAPAICSGGSVVLTMSGASYYRWSPQTGLSNPNGPDSTTVTATLTSSTTYIVTGYSAEGCSANITFTVTVHPDPVAVITPDGPLAFCQGEDVILTASGGVSFLWNDSSVSQSITVNSSGTFIVTVTDTNNCSASTSETVTVHPLPTAVISPPGPVLICTSSITATLTANTGPGFVYQWYRNDTLMTGDTSQALTVGSTGNYTVHITDGNGCTATSSLVQVLEGLGPVVTITQSPTIGCLQNTIYVGYGPQSVTLTANSVPPAASYLWSDSSITQSISVTTAGTYSVTAYDSSGCASLASPDAQVSLNVVDIRCGQGKKKILLCHVPEGNPGNPQTICVAPSAIPFHLAHHEFDCIGPCSLYYPRVDIITDEDVKVTLYPNPFSSSFVVHVENNSSEEPIHLNLTDITGRIIISDFRFSETTELGEDLSQGVYNIEIIIGERREVFKLVKL